MPMHRWRGRHSCSIASRGFTAIELIVVVSIVAIMAAIAVPSMSSFIRNANLRGAGQDLRSALIRGRSEAINRNTNVRVVPVDASWTNGWRVETVGGDEIQAASEPLSSIVTSPSPAVTVIYGVDGRVRAGAQTIVLRDSREGSVQARCITLRANGLATTSVDTDGDASNGCT